MSIGVDPGSVMDQLGHTDRFDPLWVPAREAPGRRVKRALHELVTLSDRAAMGSSAVFDDSTAVTGRLAAIKNPDQRPF